jgi:hypothetical protein
MPETEPRIWGAKVRFFKAMSVFSPAEHEDQPAADRMGCSNPAPKKKSDRDGRLPPRSLAL